MTAPRTPPSRTAIATAAAAIPTPWKDPQAWQVQIDSFRPSFRVLKSDLTGLKTSNKMDVRKGPGFDGANIVHGGRDLGEFSVELESWDEDGHRLLHAIVLTCHTQADRIAASVRSKSKQIPALAVHHPLLASRGITAMYVKDIDGPHYEKGRFRVAIACIEYAPPPKAAGTTKPASVSGTLFGKVPDVFLDGQQQKTPPLPLPSKQGTAKP